MRYKEKIAEGTKFKAIYGIDAELGVKFVSAEFTSIRYLYYHRLRVRFTNSLIYEALVRAGMIDHRTQFLCAQVDDKLGVWVPLHPIEKGYGLFITGD